MRFASLATYELIVVAVVIVSAGIAVKLDAVGLWIMDWMTP